MAANRADANSVIIAGSRFAMSTPVNMGTSNSQGVMLNVSCKACSIAKISTTASGVFVRPAMLKTTMAMKREIDVVVSIYFICENTGTSDVDAAKTVVSLIIDILSPKYAPEIMAPAVQPSLKPIALPMPISATPMVAMVVHDEPVSSDTTAQIMHEAGRKIDGLKIFRP